MFLSEENNNLTLFSLELTDQLELAVTASIGAILIIMLVLGSIWLFFNHLRQNAIPRFELDAAELGIGNQKLSFRPNHTDRQIAFAIWIEMSTRKIGLEIDLEKDIIVEVYASWYEFFGITRNLIKEIPVQKMQSKSTAQIVSLSIDLLNIGLRPHLTQWQGKYRHWWENRPDESISKAPQDSQKDFDDFDALKSELAVVNTTLIEFREKMRLLMSGSIDQGSE